MSSRPTVRIDFADFNGINKGDNFFTRILSRAYTVELSDRPDLLIYSKDGHLNRLYTCKKLFWTGETIQPDFSLSDYAMTCFHVDDPRHLRLPYYVVGGGCPPEELIKAPGEADQVAAQGRKFCSFVVSNGNPKRAGKRIDFFHRLSGYKRVDSGGKTLNNMGHPLPPGNAAKHEFIKQYKFNLCFENKSLPGYTTEKVVEAMRARCIPIYWGDPLVCRDFSPRSILSLNDFPSHEAFLDRIIEVDNDEALYRAMLSEPYFNNNEINEFYSEERILAFFERILSDRTAPLGRRRKFWPLGRWRLAKRMH